MFLPILSCSNASDTWKHILCTATALKRFFQNNLLEHIFERPNQCTSRACSRPILRSTIERRPFLQKLYIALF